jgi:hypothetical protein
MEQKFKRGDTITGKGFENATLVIIITVTVFGGIPHYWVSYFSDDKDFGGWFPCAFIDQNCSLKEQ